MDAEAFEAKWIQSVTAALEIPLPQDTPAPERAILIRLILLPAFHSPACLSLLSSPTMAMLEFREAHKPGSRERTLKSENMLLPDARDLFFECGKWRRAKLNIEDQRGLDGITIHAVIANPMQLEYYRWWTPPPNTMPSKLAARVYALALAHTWEDSTRLYLESIHGYLFETLPARIIEHDDFRTLRLYDGLWSGLEDQLSDAFAGLGDEKPLLVDMSNFQTMGTMFYPFFRRAAGRPDTVWLLSQSAAVQFDEMDFPITTRTRERDAAMEMLRRRFKPG